MSASHQISLLHKAFCETSGRDVPLNAASERMWFDAIKEGMTVNDLRIVILARQQDIKRGKRMEASLLLRNICGSEERILDVLDEASLIRARLRGKPVDHARASVLRSAGRPAPVDTAMTAVPVSEVIAAMRKAVG